MEECFFRFFFFGWVDSARASCSCSCSSMVHDDDLDDHDDAVSTSASLFYPSSIL